MSAFRESEVFPRGRRLVLVPIALVFLVGPYGAMLDGGPSDPVRWAVTMISIALCTAILALGLAPPRRTVVVDSATATVRISSTPPPPHFQQHHEVRAFADVTGTEIREVGVPRTREHGYRVVIVFGEHPELVLRRVKDVERAQRIVDHLVLLGLPGVSRLAAREAELDAPKPTTWL